MVVLNQHGPQALNNREALCQYAVLGHSKSGLCIQGMPLIENTEMAVGVIANIEVTTLPCKMADGSHDDKPYVKADNQGDSTATLVPRVECLGHDGGGDRPPVTLVPRGSADPPCGKHGMEDKAPFQREERFKAFGTR